VGGGGGLVLEGAQMFPVGSVFNSITFTSSRTEPTPLSASIATRNPLRLNLVAINEIECKNSFDMLVNRTIPD
jgi:hypothetical protein